ncbi:restriction endonuclease subunit S [Pseudomonas lopnurensis]|uniref:restriction endonuclease subunit S n=1 Tax=Pseudomonas lopnurensis TaxID=1477517 RepID=UPI0018798795|nr:restriction endonuclease subunit S [Pseudomonas lopnurensis]MBE7374676.1 restriction endonuclease subunit S [Pseudomonas lopnurensis]
MIPEDWSVVSIASVARLESGHTPSKKKPSYWNGSVPWVSLHDTSKLDALEIHSTSHTITEDGLNNSSARLLPAGTVVFSRTATVGKCCLIARAMATSQDFACYVCGTSLNNYFLVYLFRGMDRVWRNLMAGSIHNTIYMPVFKKLKIPLPSIEEQCAIATALSDMDALLDGLDRLITKKHAIKQATMQQLLTGQTRLPGYSGKWEVKRLAEVAPLQRGFDLPNPDLRSGPYPVVYSNGVLNCHAKFQVHGPGVVTGRSGTIGKVTYVEGPYWPHNTALWVTNFKENDPRFVFYLYTQIGFEKFATGSGVPTLNRNDVHNFEVLTPPTIDEQIAIATVLTDMDAEIAALETRRTKTRALKQAMMQELLTGRTRLV